MDHLLEWDEFHLNESKISIKNNTNLSIKFDTTTVGRDDWDNDLKNNKEFVFFKKVENMDVNKFLNKVNYTRHTVDKEKVKHYQDNIKNNSIIPIPIMWFADKGQYEKNFTPSFHDGTHRVLALRELGFEKIPVLMVYIKEYLS